MFEFLMGKLIKTIKRLDEARVGALYAGGIDCDFETECNDKAPEKYFKIKRENYYGLCGFKWVYGKAKKVSPMVYRLSKVALHGMEIFDLYSDDDSIPCMYLRPVGAIEVSEQEYMEATQK